MAPADPATASEEDLKFLVLALSNSPDLKVNYHALAAAVGFSTANTAQKKFKAIVEKSGQFKLINGKVVPKDAGPSTPTTPAAPADDDDDDQDDDDNEEPTPSKKRKTTTNTTPAKRSRKGRPVAQANPNYPMPSSDK